MVHASEIVRCPGFGACTGPSSSALTHCYISGTATRRGAASAAAVLAAFAGSTLRFTQQTAHEASAPLAWPLIRLLDITMTPLSCLSI